MSIYSIHTKIINYIYLSVLGVLDNTLEPDMGENEVSENRGDFDFFFKFFSS